MRNLGLGSGGDSPSEAKEKEIRDATDDLKKCNKNGFASLDEYDQINDDWDEALAKLDRMRDRIS